MSPDRRRLLALGLGAAAAAALAAPARIAAAAGRPRLLIDLGGSVTGRIAIALRPDVAPRHVERVITLARRGDYDDVVFHRVIDGFMAQTGDVRHGKRGGDLRAAGTGGSDLPDLRAEFSDLPFLRGTMGMARTQDPHSANSQFFLMFAPAPHLDGAYTVLGEVAEGLELLDRIRRGDPRRNGLVTDPDWMARVTVEE